MPSELIKKISDLFKNTALVIGGTIILISVVLFIDVKSNDDILGWVILVISTGIDIAITMSAVIYSNYSHQETSSMIKQLASRSFETLHHLKLESYQFLLEFIL